MFTKTEYNLILSLLIVCSLFAITGTADAAPVTPVYDVAGFDDFGTVVAELGTGFGGGFYVTGTITSTVYRADDAFELIQGEDSALIDQDYLTFVYRIDAGGLVNIDYLQINLPLELALEPIIAVGWNSTISDVDLTMVNTEVEPASYQIEFGDDFGGTEDAFGLLPGETIEMFITFEHVDYFQTTALMDGGGFPLGGVAVLGANVEMPEPAVIFTALAALFGLGGVAVRRLKKQA